MGILTTKYIAYVGTYTSENESDGIYTYNLDMKTGNLEQIYVTSKVDNPSYLHISPDNKFLYATLENEVYNGQIGGAVAAYSINQCTGKVDLINVEVTKGISPCNVCTSSDNKYVFVANYEGGSVSVFPVNDDGSLNELSFMVKHEGLGPDKIRQEKPHVHYVTLTPEGKYLCVVDLGIDSVKFYDLDRNLGSLTLNEKLSLKMKAGCGPRHMEFHSNGQTVYIITELSSEIAVALYSKENQTFEVVQYISTVPMEYEGENTCGAIHISPNGHYVYASNRGHDSLAIFKIDRISGKLELVGHSSSHGECPRDFEIEPTGNFLFVANQNSDSIVTFKIDSYSGKLEELKKSVKVPSPVCIKFISLESNYE
jgi:6-phosphogluconolactonase